MQLNIQQLKGMVNEVVFKRANQYYDGGFVEDLKIDFKDMTRFNAGKSMKIKGRVISFDNFNSFDIELNWDSVIERLTGYCTCHDNDTLDKEDALKSEPCEHMTAVLLKYIYEYEKKYYSEFENTELDSLIKKLKDASFDSSEYRREIELEINFVMQRYDKPYIELKIGFDKKYIVKSMKSFLDSVNNKRSIQFGKSYTYDPSIQKFNSIDQKIIDMMIEIREIDENSGNNGYSYGGYYSSAFATGKKLRLTDMLIYRFFKLVKDRTINAEIDGVKYTNVKTIAGMVPLKFEMNMKSENINISQKSLIPEQIDQNNKVLFYEGSFYLPPNEQIKLYKPIYELIKSKKNKKLVIKREEGQRAVSYLLPVLRKLSDDIVMDKKIKDNFNEVPLTIKTYLDKQDKFVTAVTKYIYGNVEIDPFKNSPKDINSRILIRDIQKEENCDKVLRSFGFEREKDCYIMKNDDNILNFVREGVESLQKLSEVFYTDSFKNIKLYGKSNIKSGIKLNDEDLLEFTFELEGVDKSELRNIFEAIREKKRYYRLKKGGFVSLEDDGMKNVSEMIEYLGANEKELADGKLMFSKYNALYLDQKIDDENMDYIERETDFKKLIKDIKDINNVDYNIPKELEKIMRNYQKTGFKWFKTLAHFGFGGILADEMGLGKTLEAIAFMESEKSDTPCLVIAPSSLLYNWQSEIEKFAPFMKALVVEGTKSQRKSLFENILEYDIVITSYPLLRRDIEEYEKYKFNYCIIDEAQQIKNAASLSANCVKKIKAKAYFALTGTPIENSLGELWSIFDFIMPGYLLTHNKFEKLYEMPIIKNDDKAALAELNSHIKPFILRRLKKDVMKELPPKIEHKLVVDMTKEQKKLYAAYLNSAKEEISKEIKINGFNKSKIKIFSILTRLRQICCDPSVFVENYKGESGKMLALSDLLEESIGHGHKILLFSQFTSVLGNIKKMIDESKIQYLYLDGSTKIHDRADLVNKFNMEDYSIFLISLKAGGTGLNLTGADVVIHFDPWWNPAVEDQASDRAHRIGQEKTVEVIKLISKGTIEEKIFNLQEKKKKMINDVINNDMNESNVITQMTQEELQNLFS